MFHYLHGDLQCVLDRDPAARTKLEVILCYPGYRAVRSYRVAHFLYRHHMRLLARIVSDRSRFHTGADIHPAAEIGERLFIDHATGVVIGETTIIGHDVTLYQGATLGGTGKETGKRHPTLGNHVTVSAGASVLGPVVVGNYAKVGAGAVVLKDVPDFATVVGVPGHVVRMRTCPSESCCKEPGETCTVPCPAQGACKKPDCPAAGKAGEAGVDLDQVHLPDPVEEQIKRLEKRLEALENTRKL